MKGLILFKNNEHVENENNKDCLTLLNIVRYLYSNKIDIRPINIVDNNIPKQITVLPSLFVSQHIHLFGLNAIVSYYEDLFGIEKLVENANTFATLNKNYKIMDISTHKKIIPIPLKYKTL